jgi:hypothetical protein
MDELMYDDGVFDPVYELALLDEAGLMDVELDWTNFDKVVQEVITDKEYNNASLGFY